MRKQAKRVLTKAQLDGVTRELRDSWRRVSWYGKRGFGRTDRALVDDYLRTHRTRKLHLGCGDHVLEGWLNVDLFPQSKTIVHLDATKPFPFGDGEFDFVYSEHMIEHISHAEGARMLAECHRILKDTGKIRLSTPDLAFLIDLYREGKTDLQHQYIEWSTERFISSAPSRDDVFVINNFMRQWGHQFIYDEKTLAAALRTAGFSGVVRRELNHSDHAPLRNLENDARMPDEFLQLETMSFEARKLRAR